MDAPRPSTPGLPRPAPVYLPQGMPLHVLHEMEARGLGPGAQALAEVLAGMQRWVMALTTGDHGTETMHPTIVPQQAVELGAAGHPALVLCEVLVMWAESGLRNADRDRAHEHCTRIARWAEQTMRAPQTALAFTQVASDLLFEDAQTIYEVGRLAAQVGAVPEAFTWLQYAHQQAVAWEDRETESLACFALGRLVQDGGHAQEALAWYHRAAEAAEAVPGPQGRVLVGDAHFERCVFHLRHGVWDQAVIHAAEAIATYGAEHPRIQRLALEIVWIWLEEQGNPYDALRLLELLEDRVREPELLLMVRACTARAAAMEEQELQCEAAWNGAWRGMGDLTTGRVQPLALLQLTYAAATLGQWSRAEVAVGAALARTRIHPLPSRWQEVAVQVLTVLQNAGGETPPDDVLHEWFPDVQRKEESTRMVGEEQERWHQELIEVLEMGMQPRTDGGPAGPFTRLLVGAN